MMLYGPLNPVATEALPLKLATREVFRAQMSKSLVGERRCFKLRPVAVLDSPRLYARCRVSMIACRKLTVVEKRKTGLSIEDSLGVQYRYTGIVYVYGNNTQASIPG